MASLKSQGGGLGVIQYALFMLSIAGVLDHILFLAHAADPDPLQDFFALVADYPALNTQGISHVRLDLEPGGVIPLHSHPLATETIFVVEGLVLTGFVSHDNKLYSKTLQKGDLYIFPRGLLHFQENVGRKPAICFNSFNGQFPALLLSANQLFATNISMGVLTKSFGAHEADMKHLTDVLPRYWG